MQHSGDDIKETETKMAGRFFSPPPPLVCSINKFRKFHEGHPEKFVLGAQPDEIGNQGETRGKLLKEEGREGQNAEEKKIAEGGGRAGGFSGGRPAEIYWELFEHV